MEQQQTNQQQNTLIIQNHIKFNEYLQGYLNLYQHFQHLQIYLLDLLIRLKTKVIINQTQSMMHLPPFSLCCNPIKNITLLCFSFFAFLRSQIIIFSSSLSWYLDASMQTAYFFMFNSLSRRIQIFLAIDIKKMLSAEKKLIQIFKTFIEKSIVPQIKKLEGSLAQWNKFSTLISTDNINIVELQYFVDSLPVWGTIENDRLKILNRRITTDFSETTNFKPNQTFGGQRNKLNVYNLNQEKSDNLDSTQEIQKDQSLRQRAIQNNQNIVSNLEKLVKSLQENQSSLDSMIKQAINQNSRISRQGSMQYNPQMPTNGHSQGYIQSPTLPHNQMFQTTTQSHHNSNSQPHHSHSHSHSQSYTQHGQTNYTKNYF